MSSSSHVAVGTPVHKGTGAITPSPPPSRDGRPSSQRPAPGGARSASPGGRRAATGTQHAATLRRYASMLQMPYAGADANSSNAEQSTLDYPGPPIEAFSVPVSGGVHSAITSHHLSIFAEKVNNNFADAQRKRDADRRVVDRRMQQIEQKVDTVGDERSRDADVRKKWAEVQGSVTGLVEELQNVARRVDSVEKNLWARTSGIDAVKQRSQELEQQVQSLEQNSRLAESSKEEVRKRESARLRRVERTIEEFNRRFSKTEDVLQSLGNSRDRSLDPGLARSLRDQAKEADETRQRLDWLEEELRGEFRQRVEWLEETHASDAVPKPQHSREAEQTEDAICQLTEQISCIMQRTSCSDQALSTLQQQVQRLSVGEHLDHGGREAVSNLPSRSMVSLQAELGAMSQQVADVSARLIDVEGSLEFGDGRPACRDIGGGRDEDGEGCAQLDDVMREVAKMKQYLGALQQQQRLTASAQQTDNNGNAGGGSEASPSRSQAQRREREDMVPEFEELPQRFSHELRGQQQDSARSRGEDLDVLEDRLGKLEESTDLYLSYTKCVASDHGEQLEKLAIRLEEVENSHEVVQRLLHDAEDAAPAGPRSIGQQLDDVRDQVASLRNGDSPANGDMARGRGDGRQRLDFDEVSERLAVVEERVEQNCEMAATQIDKILQRVSEDLEYTRHDIEEAKASVSVLSEQVLVIDSRTQQSIPACLAPNSALGATIANFCSEFKLKADTLDVMDAEDLEHVEAALQHMQGTCLQAADHIAKSVQSELQALCARETNPQKVKEAQGMLPLSPGGDDRSSPSSGSIQSDR